MHSVLFSDPLSIIITAMASFKTQEAAGVLTGTQQQQQHTFHHLPQRRRKHTICGSPKSTAEHRRPVRVTQPARYRSSHPLHSAPIQSEPLTHLRLRGVTDKILIIFAHRIKGNAGRRRNTHARKLEAYSKRYSQLFIPLFRTGTKKQHTNSPNKDFLTHAESFILICAPREALYCGNILIPFQCFRSLC